MELRGEAGGVKVYDDFAHHPTAIRTTVDGLRRKVGARSRILAVFEPRSNTMKLGTMKAQLPWALEDADLVFCHSGGLGWDATRGAGADGRQGASVVDNIRRPGRSAWSRPPAGRPRLCMSNGGFGGIHAKLLAALSATVPCP